MTRANSVTAALTQMFRKKCINGSSPAVPMDVVDVDVVDMAAAAAVALTGEQGLNKELARRTGGGGGHWSTERTDPAARAKCHIIE
jgi:hypothetical protein